MIFKLVTARKSSSCRLLLLYAFYFLFGCTLQGLPIIHATGDSHSREFRLLPGVKVHWFTGMTMHRAGRDGFGAVYVPRLGVKEGDVVIFSFGEIDARCHIGRIRDKAGRNLDEIINTLATNYIQTVLNNRALYTNLLCVVYSVTPPTVCHNIYLPTWGTLEDRVFITKKLNKRLAEVCSQAGIDFLDVYDDYAMPNGTLNLLLSDGNVHIKEVCDMHIAHQLWNILRKNNINMRLYAPSRFASNFGARCRVVPQVVANCHLDHS